jgi:ornithine racemase
MAYLKLYKDKLKHNYQFLNKIFKDKNIEWGIVSKVLCGHKEYLSQLIDLGIHEIHDSRISNLVTVKKLNPEVQTVYIKPPAKRSIPKVVRYADVSFNTELATIKMISEEAVKQNKIHKIIIMIEMGDLREGVMGEDLVEFYEKIFKQPGISVVGLGTNLNCLHGVIPNPDKLIQISLYKQIIEAKFNRRIPWVSGGTSVVFPLLLNRQLPSGINHFRMGETLFFGNNLLTNENIDGMETGVFELFTEIIELAEKPAVPIGEMGQNVMGETTEVDEELYGETTTRAIIDIGQLDIDPKFLMPRDKDVEIVGASSDMLVLDIGDNKHGYKVGDLIAFKLEYMGVLGIMNSNYITKLVVD